MATLTEARRAGDFLISEAPGTISRKTVTVTVAAATTLGPGQVLGKITTGGKHVPVNNDATPAADGSEAARAILYGPIENTGVSPADFVGVVIDWTAEVRSDGLVWGGSDEAAGLLELENRGIKALA